MKNMIKIRLSKQSDIPQLEEIFLVSRQQAFHWKQPDSFEVEDFKKFTAGEVVLVAEENREILGFLSIWPMEHFIHNLFIHPDRQNRGAGKLLLKKAIELFPPPLELKAIIYNIKACQFYEKQGWSIVETHVDAPEPYHLYRYV